MLPLDYSNAACAHIFCYGGMHVLCSKYHAQLNVNYGPNCIEGSLGLVFGKSNKENVASLESQDDYHLPYKKQGKSSHKSPLKTAIGGILYHTKWSYPIDLKNSCDSFSFLGRKTICEIIGQSGWKCWTSWGINFDVKNKLKVQRKRDTKPTLIRLWAPSLTVVAWMWSTCT